jgi:diaminopropionate ammonia-lyase
MSEKPIQWTKNKFKTSIQADPQLETMLPADLSRKIRSFHRQLPGYRMSPLKGLSNLADKLGLGGIWVKDESADGRSRRTGCLG